MNLFLVEDDEIIAKSLEEYLTSWGHKVTCVRDFTRVAQEVREAAPDLVIMDVVLPSYNGFYWCQQIRAFSTLPILILSSKSDDMDLIQGMQMGADDYVTNPVSLEVVRAKIDALLRRSYEFGQNANELVWNGVKLDLAKTAIYFRDRQLDLTRTELLILEPLFVGRGKVISREALIDHCWQSENFIDDNTLAVNISRLRKKLREIGLENLIGTKKGIGYCLSEET